MIETFFFKEKHERAVQRVGTTDTYNYESYLSDVQFSVDPIDIMAIVNQQEAVYIHFGASHMFSVRHMPENERELGLVYKKWQDAFRVVETPLRETVGPDRFKAAHDQMWNHMDDR